MAMAVEAPVEERVSSGHISPERVKDLRKRHAALLTERSEWLTDWRTLADHFHPGRFRALDEDSFQTNKPNLNDTLVNNESVRSMRVLAAGMQGGMTSPARPWFRLGVPDPELEEASAVKEWLADVQRIILNVMARSNFYDSIHQLYEELGTFGPGVIFALEDDDTVVRFKTLTCGEYCLVGGHNGRVKGVFRILDMTADQMCVRFGRHRVSDSVKTAYDDESTRDTWFQVAHVILPNDKRRPMMIDGTEKEFESFYYEYNKEKPNDAPQLLAYGGYEEQPFAAPRWAVIGNDIYGRSPGMETLNDVRMLQSMMSTMLKAIHKNADPPVIAPTDHWNINTVPGAINSIDTTGRGEGFKPLYQVTPDTRGVMIAVEAVKDDIREGLYNDLFKMLALGDRGNMTATEVRQRIEEKLIMLGPVIERLHAELLDVLIDRIFAVCLRRGLFPPPPDVMQGRELKVEYISLLAQAQKMIGTSAIDQFMLLVGSYTELFPEMADIPDIDEVGQSYAEMLGVDPKLVRSVEEREARRDERRQAVAAQQEMEQSMAAADTMKTMGDTKLEENSALRAFTDGLVGS